MMQLAQAYETFLQIVVIFSVNPPGSVQINSDDLLLVLLHSKHKSCLAQETGGTGVWVTPRFFLAESAGVAQLLFLS